MSFFLTAYDEKLETVKIKNFTSTKLKFNFKVKFYFLTTPVYWGCAGFQEAIETGGVDFFFLFQHFAFEIVSMIS